ncbi:hypothetical protein PS1_015222 [Malus domestica]
MEESRDWARWRRDCSSVAALDTKEAALSCSSFTSSTALATCACISSSLPEEEEEVFLLASPIAKIFFLLCFNRLRSMQFDPFNRNNQSPPPASAVHPKCLCNFYGVYWFGEHDRPKYICTNPHWW